MIVTTIDAIAIIIWISLISVAKKKQENTLIPISSIEMIVIRILFGIDILFSIPLSEIFYKLKIILYSNWLILCSAHHWHQYYTLSRLKRTTVSTWVETMAWMSTVHGNKSYAGLWGNISAFISWPLGRPCQPHLQGFIVTTILIQSNDCTP